MKLPDTQSPDHARLILEFVGAVRKHLVAFITSSIIAAVLWLLQGVGWITPRPWLVWSVAVVGLLISVYQAWVDERLRLGERLAALEKSLCDEYIEIIDRDFKRRIHATVHGDVTDEFLLENIRGDERVLKLAILAWRDRHAKEVTMLRGINKPGWS